MLFRSDGRARSGAGGAPGAVRGGQLSKSVAKASRGGIGGGQKRGISTFLFRRSGVIRAFATDLDNLRCCGPLGGAPRAGRRPRRAPPGAETCTSHPKVQFQPSFSRTKCTSRRRSGPVAVVADRGADPAPEHLRRPDEKGSAVLLEDDAQRAPQDLLPGPCGCVAHWRTAPLRAGGEFSA